VTPEGSKTYHLTVTAAPPPPSATSPAEEDLLSQNVVDTFFEYDKCDIQADQQGSLHAGRSFCSSTPTSASRSRDTATNVARSNTTWALGTSRADAVKNALTQAGIGGDRIQTVSYGKEKAFCTDNPEECWLQNRRGRFVHGK
jgi:peptidoglycan-associated lipoprotein